VAVRSSVTGSGLSSTARATTARRVAATGRAEGRDVLLAGRRFGFSPAVVLVWWVVGAGGVVVAGDEPGGGFGGGAFELDQDGGVGVGGDVQVGVAEGLLDGFQVGPGGA
jgi:hypothetical protein